ncbi:hypothetical protein GCM10008986_18930 [Salinibacillus aidingensis]|uniref:DNA phosphorothioation-dependent restriction protein DptF n=1 Tax=Salinibacillus aidingensis TaxID=237684 RepID=A0ABP3L3R9_9BACI
MSEYTFDFLQELDPELVQIGRSIENIFYDDPHGVLVKSRLFAEHMTKTIASLENLDHIKSWKQVDRIAYLDREGLFTKEVAQSFDMIRYIGNRAAHADGKGDLEKALKVHKNLFKISVWFAEVYGSYDFKTPEYQNPPMRKTEGLDTNQITKLIESTLSKQLSSFFKQQAIDEGFVTDDKPGTNQKELVEEQQGNPQEEEPPREEEEQHDTADQPEEGPRTLYGSELLFQLSKLKESSQEAIEGSEAFSSFKKYLHVERPIQNDLEHILRTKVNEQSSQLIFLCGSVGDGKSHLLAYMNETYPDLMANFKVHNDATESFDPHKNSLDTLAEVLEPFSDANIDKTNEKRILAINLGVLHNFLESSYVKESYTKLASFISESKIFETDYVSENYMDDHFNLISFSDYHPYELTKEGPESSYFMNIFEKIVQPTDDNPFYRAFNRDQAEGIMGPYMTNYKLLQQKTVRQKLSQLLIKAIVQHKYILSTRTLLNFVHDILIPSNLEEHLTSTSVIEETQALLPNMLFNSSDRSPLLKVISYVDPIHTRSEMIDQMLIELNNSTDISKVFQKNISQEGLKDWVDALSDLGPFYELTKATRQVLNTSLIRFCYFLSDEMEEIFKNKTYNDFMHYLYAFNLGIPAGLKGIYQETEDAIFAWKGSPKGNDQYIYYEESMGSMNIAQTLELKRYTNHLVKRDQDVFYRFKDTLLIGFQNQHKTEYALLEIDYPLYETMVKVLNGYRPNKKDKEDAIQFLEFVEKLMQIGKKEDEMVIHDLTEDLLFKLEYDAEFEEFTFKRE